MCDYVSRSIVTVFIHDVFIKIICIACFCLVETQEPYGFSAALETDRFFERLELWTSEMFLKKGSCDVWLK